MKPKTDEFRRLLEIRDGETFPVLHALEHGISTVDEAFMYQIVDNCDWNDSGIDALYSPADKSCPYRVVYIKASLFARAEDGDMAALFCIVHELCHWFEDFKYGVRVPQDITHAATRRVMSHIIELYTTVFTYHVFPCDAFSGRERAEQISGSRELDRFMLAYRKFTDWRSSYVARAFGASRGTEKPQRKTPGICLTKAGRNKDSYRISNAMGIFYTNLCFFVKRNFHFDKRKFRITHS